MTRHRFTLVEVLVALMVTAIVIPITLKALMTVGQLGETTHRRHLAAELAELKLHELVVTGDWLDAATSGDFGDDYPGYSWELATDEISMELVAMQQLDVTVFGPGRLSDTAVTLTTWVEEAEE